jgi:hypothetical protein
VLGIWIGIKGGIKKYKEDVRANLSRLAHMLTIMTEEETDLMNIRLGYYDP